MRTTTLIVATAMAFALAGCGGKSASGNSDTASSDQAVGTDAAKASTLDPCSLISATDMSGMIGDTVTGTRRIDADGCDYDTQQGDGIQIKVHATDGQHQMEIVHKSGQLLGGMGAAVADKGGAGSDVNDKLKADTSATPTIGDEAVWEANDTLAVRKGNAFVEVSPPIMHNPQTHPGNPMIPDAEKRKIAQTVATALLAKLNP